MPSAYPIHNVAEYVIRTSVNLPTSKRIQLLEDTLEVLPDGADLHAVQRIVDQLREADRACLEFSFATQF